MDQNWNDNERHNEHMGYSDSDFSPNENTGGGGRFSGSNYGGSGSGTYYGAGYDPAPYGDDTNAGGGMGRSSYRDSGSGGYRENNYGNDRSGSYGGGRTEEGYGRGGRYNDDRYRNYDRPDEYGTTGRSNYGSYDEYERDRRSRFGGQNYEGRRRGTSGSFPGYGYGDNDSRDEGRGYGLSDIGWNPSSFVGPDNYGRRGHRQRPEDMNDVGGYGHRDRGGRRGYYEDSGSYSDGMRDNYYENSNSYGSGRVDWDRNESGYGAGGSRARDGYRGVRGGTGRSDWSYRNRTSYGRDMNDFYESPGEGGEYYDRGEQNADDNNYGDGNYGTGRSSHTTGRNTSRGEMPGGSNFSDPWL